MVTAGTDYYLSALALCKVNVSMSKAVLRYILVYCCAVKPYVMQSSNERAAVKFCFKPATET